MAPFSSDWLVQFIGKNSLAVATLIVGVFVASPPLGYLLYTFYDTIFYNWLAMNWGKRRSIWSLVVWASRDNSKLSDVLKEAQSKPPRELGKVRKKLCPQQINEVRAAVKSLIDFVILSEPNDPTKDKISSGVATNLRGYWSHVATRFICGVIVPMCSAVLAVVGFLFFSQIGVDEDQTLLMNPSRYYQWLPLSIFIVILLSVMLLSTIRRPRDEAFELEHYVILSRLSNRSGSENDSLGVVSGYLKQRIINAKIRRNLPETGKEGQPSASTQPQQTAPAEAPKEAP